MPTTDRTRTCSVDDCIVTGELDRRPSRPPDYEAENGALATLADTLARRPGDVLQRLTDIMLELDLGDSTGISLIEGEGPNRIFRWVALSGEWGHFKGGTMPFSASPCGVVVTRDEVMLFQHPERAFPDAKIDPLIDEILLVPFAVSGDAVGTVWANAHSGHRKFNREDARLLARLSRFASAAHQMAAALGESERRLESTDAVLRESEQRLTLELSASRVLQQLSTRLIPEQSPESLYDQILDTALELMRADAASMQLLEDDGKRLRRVATRNLHPASTEYWTWVDASHASTCGQALSKNERVVVKDVEASPELIGTGDLEAFRASGTRAVQSTPLLTRRGKPIGMISTHWRAPRKFDGSDFDLFDVLARQIADLFERSKTEAALRESERHANLLLAELQHRVRNMLAVVRSIALRTAENSNSVEEMLAHLQGRLDAFSRVQAALTRSPDARIDLASLIDDELVAHAARGGEQFRIYGPPVALEPKTAERLSLAIHELTTNSVKHGALVSDRGKIRIRWRKEGLNGSEMLILDWSESGVDIDTGGVRREGFGMELLRRSLPYDLQGTTEVELRETGLRFELRMPMPKRTEDG